ncbi:MAG: sodium:proton antiporter [Elusimicrobia bacterium CG_4_9_14_3_um_filter_62_55]|nr:MAG: sodium:proton antiporter [Elusimicrobia bacterium CG22_combo_CG10-13_8_21_14_all_63_91]PJA16945.1 MAG: sodium:proton antiporter [Elusimicrobia bacterium CG_4_10_14_0_2_um_filter_63_34]PJB26906.1 MAG: sodium:proton antiporter [Elusimicrobia bacterium CG_4_9_14_3_um_filter_62_55]
MTHSTALISTIAASLSLSLVLGFLAHRLRLPLLVGYLFAGILIGPSTPGLIADPELTAQLAEIGVILLMFGVGLHFSIDDLKKVRRIALPGAVGQIAVATALGATTAWAWGWDLRAGIVFGLALSVASTVVLLRALERRKFLATVNGRIAVGWLIVEDIVMVLVLVSLPALADGAWGAPLLRGLAWTLGKVALFIALMLLVGKRAFPRLLMGVANTGSRELFTLAVISVALGVAYTSAKLFDVSFALGAFFAGMVMRESELSHRAAEESLPLRDAFSVLFFVSVGMLFDPAILVTAPLKVLVVVAIIIVGKSLAAFVLVLAFRYPLNTALTVSAALSQIGEFSFILVGLGGSLGLLPPEGISLILAGALISISANDLVFRAVEPAAAWIRSRSRLAAALDRSTDPLAGLPSSVKSALVTSHAVLVGYGRVGRRIGDALAEAGVRVVVAEENRETVASLRDAGGHAVAGDASRPEVLIQAHIARASLLILAVPDAAQALAMIDTARKLNPRVRILARSHSDAQGALLSEAGADQVYLGEEVLAAVMCRDALLAAGRS